MEREKERTWDSSRLGRVGKAARRARPNRLERRLRPLNLLIRQPSLLPRIRLVDKALATAPHRRFDLVRPFRLGGRARRFSEFAANVKDEDDAAFLVEFGASEGGGIERRVADLVEECSKVVEAELAAVGIRKGEVEGVLGETEDLGGAVVESLWVGSSETGRECGVAEYARCRLLPEPGHP